MDSFPHPNLRDLNPASHLTLICAPPCTIYARPAVCSVNCRHAKRLATLHLHVKWWDSSRPCRAPIRPFALRPRSLRSCWLSRSQSMLWVQVYVKLRLPQLMDLVEVVEGHVR